MTRTILVLAIATCTTVLHAETILKFDLGSAGYDFELVGTTLSTVDDLGATTAGDQDTNVNFTGFLSGMSDITTDTASFSLSEVQLSGSAITAGGLVIQPTTGGEFKLWDDANTLLLAGLLDNGSITGALGGSATGSFINVDLATVSGGTLAPLLDPDSLSLAISFTSVNGGSGFSVSGSTLDPFEAAATGNIAAFVPEPTSFALGLFSLLGLCGFTRRRYR